MIPEPEPPKERGSVGLLARWAAEPYLAFKNDHLRLYALIARDIRKVVIVAMMLHIGQYVPWRGWFSWI